MIISKRLEDAEFIMSKDELTYSLKPIVDPGPLFSSSLPQREKKYEQDFL